jgi:hypothetical protein
MPSNIAASVRQRLLNRARVVNRPFNELLQYYANATVRNQKFEGDWRATGPWQTGKDRAD